MEDPELETAKTSDDEETPVTLVMVEADGADVCAVDGTCW